MKNKLLFLVSIVVLGLFLRLYKLDSRPLGFTWDEAALGYNAYSLLLTGKDEYGEKLPTVFKSFGDYKPGAYVYFAVPSVALLGLSEFSTRLPSAIIGALFIGVIWVLSKKISGSWLTAHFAAVIMAINPWAIHFSRGAWEVNLFVFLATLATACFLKSKYLWSAILWGITLSTYQGAKLFTPLLIGLLLVTLPKIQIKKLLVPGLLLFLMAVPILIGAASQSGRLKVFSAFSYTRHVSDLEKILNHEGAMLGSWQHLLFHSNLLDQITGFTQRYLNYFSPRFLFFNGDWTNLRHGLVYFGYFHPIEILTIALGIIYFLRNPNRYQILLWGWLFIAPLPAALSRDLVTGVRSLQMMVPLIMLSAMGLQFLGKKWWLLATFLMILGFSTAYYMDMYYVHNPTFSQAEWLYPYSPAFKAVLYEQNNYEKIIFTDKLGQPYIFALFHSKYDPATYQLESRLIENKSGDVGRVDKFGKYEFRSIYWPEDRNLQSTLFVGDFYELPEQDLNMENVDRISEVRLPDNLNGLRVVGLR